MSDCRINSCCFCISLEFGGKIWGWLGIVCGIASLLINSYAAVKYFLYLDAMESYEIFISILSFITIIVSVTLLIGIRRKSHKMLKPTLLLALYSYIATVLFAFYIYCTYDFESQLVRKTEDESPRYYTPYYYFYPYFSDSSSFDGVDVENTTDQPNVEDQAFTLKNLFVATILVSVGFDFIFRYLMIDALHQRYKDKCKATDIV